MALFSRGLAGFLGGLGKGYIDQKNLQADRAIKQQNADTDRMNAQANLQTAGNTNPVRVAAAKRWEEVASFIQDNRYTLQVTGQLPMFQRYLNALGQTISDGNYANLAGYDWSKMMDDAAKNSQRFAHATDDQLSAMGWSPETITEYRKTHPAPTDQTTNNATANNGPTLEELDATDRYNREHPPLPFAGYSSGFDPLSSTPISLNTNPIPGVGHPGGPQIDPQTGSPFGVGMLSPDPMSTPAYLNQLGNQTYGAPEIVPSAYLPHRATGGTAPAGVPTEVGETGSELFVPDYAKTAVFNPSMVTDVRYNPGTGSTPVTSTPVASPAVPKSASSAPSSTVPASTTDNTSTPPSPTDFTANFKPVPSIPIPDNPAESASPGFGQFAHRFYTEGVKILDSMQGITPQQAQSLATELVGRIYSDPTVIASRLDLMNTMDPRFASTPDDTVAAQKNYTSALKDATDKATQVLTAEMMPIAEPNKVNQQKFDNFLKLGSTVFGPQGVGGATKDLTEAGLAKSKEASSEGKDQALSIQSLETAVYTRQKAYDEHPNSVNLRNLRNAQAEYNRAHAAQLTEQAATDHERLLHTEAMDALTKTDPLTANIIKNVIHPRMMRDSSGKVYGGSLAGRGIGAIAGAILGGVAGASTLTPFGVAAGVAGGASLGGELGGGIGGAVSARYGDRESHGERDMVFDPALGFSLLEDPRFHDRVTHLFRSYAGSPQNVDGNLPSMTPGNDAITGSDYVMMDRLHPGWIVQQQSKLTGKELQTFNGDVRAYRNYKQQMGRWGVQPRPAAS